MKLWLLEERDDLSREDNPWLGIYDYNAAFVIRAEDETQARKMAFEKSAEWGDEDKNVWLNEKYTTCKNIPIDGVAEVITVERQFG